MPITVDLAASLEYRKRLKDYCSANVLTPDLKFVCKHEKKCRFSAEELDNSFAPGQLSYVGDGYAAEENGIPMRILIVSFTSRYERGYPDGATPRADTRPHVWEKESPHAWSYAHSASPVEYPG